MAAAALADLPATHPVAVTSGNRVIACSATARAEECDEACADASRRPAARNCMWRWQIRNATPDCSSRSPRPLMRWHRASRYFVLVCWCSVREVSVGTSVRRKPRRNDWWIRHLLRASRVRWVWRINCPQRSLPRAGQRWCRRGGGTVSGAATHTGVGGRAQSVCAASRGVGGSAAQARDQNHRCFRGFTGSGRRFAFRGRCGARASCGAR